MKTFLSTIIFFTTTCFCQVYTFNSAFGNFQNASSFSINSAGFIYVTDSGTDKLYKYDTLGIYIEEAGGYGWTEETFDDPVDVFATTLNVYVCDKNNHRIQAFDKDLNFISELSTRGNDNRDEQFGYPLACATSSQGDLFILDSENKRILKFDLFGNYLQNFGGMDAGSYSLDNPTNMSISSSIKTFIIDGKDIVMFDNYGNGLAVIQTELELKGIEIYSELLSVNTGNEIYLANLNAAEFKLEKLNLIGMDYEPEFVSAIIQRNKLYILTEKEVLSFTLVKLPDEK